MKGSNSTTKRPIAAAIGIIIGLVVIVGLVIVYVVTSGGGNNGNNSGGGNPPAGCNQSGADSYTMGTGQQSIHLQVSRIRIHKKKDPNNRDDVWFIGAMYNNSNQSEPHPIHKGPQKVLANKIGEWVSWGMPITIDNDKELVPLSKVSLLFYEKDITPNQSHWQYTTADGGACLYYKSKETRYGVFHLEVDDFNGVGSGSTKMFSNGDIDIEVSVHR